MEQCREGNHPPGHLQFGSEGSSERSSCRLGAAMGMGSETAVEEVDLLAGQFLDGEIVSASQNEQDEKILVWHRVESSGYIPAVREVNPCTLLYLHSSCNLFVFLLFFFIYSHVRLHDSDDFLTKQ